MRKKQTHQMMVNCCSPLFKPTQISSVRLSRNNQEQTNDKISKTKHLICKDKSCVNSVKTGHKVNHD